MIKIKLDDVTVVDGGGRWRLVPTTHNIEYTVGNTVEVQDSHGVLRVLHKDPIRLVEFGELDASIVEGFKPTARERAETFDDFGGLPEVVARARDLIEVPLAHHERLTAINARPVKGVLFTGPPGAGKTMLARIIANSSEADFLEIIQDDPAAFGLKDVGELAQVRLVSRMLGKVLAGLVPLRGRAVHYDSFDLNGRAWLIHSSISAQLTPPPPLTPVFLVGVAQEGLFWKDVRRVVFSGSCYRALARLDTDGLRPTWTPVKLVDVLRGAIPDFANVMDTMNKSVLSAMSSAATVQRSGPRTTVSSP